MTQTDLIAVIAAIVFNGADRPEGAAGYTPAHAVIIAREIYAAAMTPNSDLKNGKVKVFNGA